MSFRDIGRALSNWGRWGADDRLGTANLLTGEALAAAAGEVRRGRLFDLALPLVRGSTLGGAGRAPLSHFMGMSSLDFRDREDRMIVTDDNVVMPLQCGTQWDGLAHIGYDGSFYNGVSAETVTTLGGSSCLSVHQFATKGLAGRGVLLDIAGARGCTRLEAGASIGPDELSAVAAAQGCAIRSGDILLIRTGWVTTLRDRAGDFWNGEPGLHLDCAAWLADHGISAVGADNWGVEVVAPDDPHVTLPFHCVAIRDMGMPLGELFDLEELAEDCRAEGSWTCLFVAPPLKIVGAVGTPTTPIAIR